MQEGPTPSGYVPTQEPETLYHSRFGRTVHLVWARCPHIRLMDAKGPKDKRRSAANLPMLGIALCFVIQRGALQNTVLDGRLDVELRAHGLDIYSCNGGSGQANACVHGH